MYVKIVNLGIDETSIHYTGVNGFRWLYVDNVEISITQLGKIPKTGAKL